MSRIVATRFAGLAALAWGGFILFTLAFPFMVYAAIHTTCESACGAVAMIAGLRYKPIAYLVFIGILSLLVAMRLRALQFSAGWAIPFGISMLSDMAVATAFGAHWSVGFAMGILTPGLPFSLVAAFVTCIFLSLVGEENPRLRATFAPAFIAAAYGLLLSDLALRLAYASALPLWPGLRTALYVVVLFLRPFAVPALIAVYAYVLLSGSGPDRRAVPDSAQV